MFSVLVCRGSAFALALDEAVGNHAVLLYKRSIRDWRPVLHRIVRFFVFRLCATCILNHWIYANEVCQRIVGFLFSNIIAVGAIEFIVAISCSIGVGSGDVRGLVFIRLSFSSNWPSLRLPR